MNPSPMLAAELNAIMTRLGWDRLDVAVALQVNERQVYRWLGQGMDPQGRKLGVMPWAKAEHLRRMVRDGGG